MKTITFFNYKTSNVRYLLNCTIGNLHFSSSGILVVTTFIDVSFA